MPPRDDPARDPVRLHAERWAAESPFVDEAAEEQAPIHPWYQGYTPFVEGRELEETYGPEAEWESDLAALEAESPLQSAFDQGRTSLIEPGELEGLGRESEQETGEEEGKFERDSPLDPPPTKCGFHGPNGVFVTEADLRSAVANVALDERKKWWGGTSGTAQKEDNPTRFGDLVRYWLASLFHTPLGRDRKPLKDRDGKQVREPIHPGKLEAVQQAALDPSIPYGNLKDAALNEAIRAFGVAEKKVNDWSAEVYKRSSAEDSARAKAEAADAEEKAADKAVKAAEARVKDARRQSGSAAQAALDAERNTLRDATTAHSTARRKHDAAKTGLGVATKARKEARRKHNDAVTARDRPVRPPPLEVPASAWTPTDRRMVRTALLAKAAATDPQDINDIIDQALLAAHRSRADVEAWSAVFVVSCVRAAAIGRKLEAMDSGLHVGKDGLLKASRRHSDYVVEARERKRKAVGGTYHAFEPGDPEVKEVKIGDIICTDREDFIPKPVALKDLQSRRKLHCDIVTSIEAENGKPFAVTIGGNVGNTVRRRRYPLDSQGRLVVSAGQLFAQEKDNGAFPPFEKLEPVPTTMLAVASTGRILALLRPVVECKKPAPAPTSKGAPTGKGERFLGHSLESLESPFLDEEILPTERRNEFDSSVERLADESPFVGALEERRSRFNEDQLEEEEAPDELEGGEELEAEEVWKELEEELVEEQERADADDYAFHQGDLSERGTFANHDSWDPAATLEFEAAGCTGDHELPTFQGELLDSEIWQGEGTDEHKAFRDRVLEAHIARSRKPPGAAVERAPKRDLSREELHGVEGTKIEMGLEAAAAAGRLLAAANADLAKDQAAGHPDALRTIRLSATSGYRSNAKQKRLWLDYFTAKGGYYDQTQAARERLAGGPHSEEAVTYMLTPKKKGGFGLGGRIAAPGYSNHQGGIAIDFWQVRKKGHEIPNNSGEKARAKWRSTWFHEWLRDNAAKTFGFQPIPTEEWHWEYRPGSGTTASAATSTGPSIVTPTTLPAPSTARPAAELVRFAQRVLNAAEGERLGDDGNLGRLTRVALERFRKKYGLGMGGVLDTLTELALAQRALEELAQASMFARPGTRDARTEQALITFKSTRGLGGMDARLDATTRRALTDALARMAPKPASTSTYLGGKLWTFESKTLPTRVAVFCPQAALSMREVEVLVYAHGLLNGCPRPKSIPDGMITDAPFKLGDIVAASGRPTVLVVPYLDWANPGGENAFGKARRKWHALGKPAHLNSLVAEVLAELGRVQSIATPSLRNLVIAGHSRAYDLLEPLAHSHSDQQMQQGALARLSQVWAFDTTYVGDVSKWMSWLDAKPGLKVSVFYEPGSKTGVRGDAFYSKRSARLAVIQAREGHCAVPARRLPALLKLPISATDQETEAPWGEDELERGEANLEAEDYAPEAYNDATGAAFYREFDEAFGPAEEHYEVDRFDPLYELNADEQHLSAEPELDALAFEALGSDDEHISDEGAGLQSQVSKEPRAEVRALQKSLNKWRVENGRMPIKEDGLLSAETNKAVLEFQKASGFKRVHQDGIAGPFTRERLTLLLDILKNIPTSPVWTVERRRLVELVGSAGFRSLEGPTQTEVLKRIMSYQGSPGALDKIRHLTNLVTQTGFELLPTSSQKLMLRALAARPDDAQLADDLSQLAGSPGFRNLEGPTQTEVLKRIEGYAGNRRKINNLVILITLSFLFDGLSKKSQKLMLVAHANHPEDTRLVEDFLTLAGRIDFSQLDQPTQTDVLNRIRDYPRGTGNVENLMNLVTTPDFKNLATDVRDQILNGLPSRFDNVQLNPPNIGNNPPTNIGNMMSLVTASGFEKLRREVRDLMLDVQANRPDNLDLASALRNLAESPRFRHDHRMARQTILRLADSIP